MSPDSERRRQRRDGRCQRRYGRRRAGGSPADARQDAGGPSDSMVAPEQPTAGPDGPSVPAGQCKATPSATAGMLRLAFRQLQITGDINPVGPRQERHRAHRDQVCAGHDQ